MKIQDSEQPTNITEIRDVVHSFFDFYTARNKDGLMSIIGGGSDNLSWGTGESERIIGPTGYSSQFDQDFSQSEGMEWELVSEQYHVRDRFGWGAVEVYPVLITEGKKTKLPVLRCSLVCEFDSSSWKIVHSHASWPFPEQKDGDSFPS